MLYIVVSQFFENQVQICCDFTILQINPRIMFFKYRNKEYHYGYEVSGT